MVEQIHTQFFYVKPNGYKSLPGFLESFKKSKIQ